MTKIKGKKEKNLRRKQQQQQKKILFENGSACYATFNEYQTFMQWLIIEEAYCFYKFLHFFFLVLDNTKMFSHICVQTIVSSCCHFIFDVICSRFEFFYFCFFPLLLHFAPLAFANIFFFSFSRLLFDFLSLFRFVYSFGFFFVCAHQPHRCGIKAFFLAFFFFATSIL